MGIRYQYFLVTNADAVDDLLIELAKHLTEEDRERVLAAMPWRPAEEKAIVWGSEPAVLERHGIGGLQSKDEYEHSNDYCFSFVFPLDPEVEVHARSNGYIIRGQHVEIGCIWTSLHVGEEYAFLQCTAAASSISVALAHLAGVRSAWVELARGCQALALWLDTDDHENQLVYPEMRKVPSVFERWFRSPDETCLRVDAYCEAALAPARVR